MPDPDIPEPPVLRHPVEVPPPGSELERVVSAAQRDPYGFVLDGDAARWAEELGLPERHAKRFFLMYAYLLLLLQPPVKY